MIAVWGSGRKAAIRVYSSPEHSQSAAQLSYCISIQQRGIVPGHTVRLLQSFNKLVAHNQRLLQRGQWHTTQRSPKTTRSSAELGHYAGSGRANSRLGEATAILEYHTRILAATSRSYRRACAPELPFPAIAISRYAAASSPRPQSSISLRRRS
jgi:hypothetical protein